MVQWADQGVLLLNVCLTVRAHEANSHSKKGWEQFTDAVVAALNRKRKDLVFLLWGRNAEIKGKSIDRQRHHVLTAAHPSGLSANRVGSPHQLQMRPIQWVLRACYVIMCPQLQPLLGSFPAVAVV